MPRIVSQQGTFADGIPYVRLGAGGKDLIVFFGGPGNMLPTGFGLRMMTKGFVPLLDACRLTFVSRRPGLPEGVTTRDMSDHYAEMIRRDLAGHVDVVVGISYGGMIAQHFAADHADLFDHIVIAMVAHRGSDAGMQVDMQFATLLNQGKPRQAYAMLADVMAPEGIGRSLMRALLWLVGTWMPAARDESSRRDVLIEAQAELTHDATERLGRIEVPVLILCGDADPYFPLPYIEETARMIPDAELKLYAGKGHDIMMDARFGRDILDFVTT